MGRTQSSFFEGKRGIFPLLKFSSFILPDTQCRIKVQEASIVPYASHEDMWATEV